MDQTIQVLGVINVLSNGYCCFYVYKTFNIKICLNFIMWFDAAFSSIYSILILVLSWITIFPDPIICSFATFSLFIPTLFYYYNFFSAYVRYKRVSSSINNQLWKTEAEVVKDAIALIGTVMSIDILVVILNSVFDMGWFRFYSICMGKNYSSMSPAFIRRLFHMGAMTSTFLLTSKPFGWSENTIMKATWIKVKMNASRMTYLWEQVSLTFTWPLHQLLYSSLLEAEKLLIN